MSIALNDLSDKERKVIELRFGLGDGHPRTVEQVGREFGVTRERIRQIESKALAKLRKGGLGYAVERIEEIVDYCRCDL